MEKFFFWKGSFQKVQVLKQGPARSRVFIPLYSQVLLVENHKLLDSEPKMKPQNLYKVLNQMVRLWAKKQIRSLLVTGPGGLGKTFMVKKTLESMDVDYLHLSGYSSAAGLFTALAANKDAFLVLDDMDSVFRNEEIVNILKAVLDTTGDRRVVWNTLSTQVPVKEFVFTGGIIFISNMHLHQLNEYLGALLTRLHKVHFDLPRHSVLQKIKEISKKSDSPMAKEVFSFIKRNQHDIPDLSLRTYVLTLELAEGLPSDWKAIAGHQWLSGGM